MLINEMILMLIALPMVPNRLTKLWKMNSSNRTNQDSNNKLIFNTEIEKPNQDSNVIVSNKRFLRKIPNRSVLRDFFTNNGKFYVPPKKDLTGKFCSVINYYYF